MERTNHIDETESIDSNNHYHDEIRAILCQMDHMIQSNLVDIPKISTTIYQLFYEVICDEDQELHSRIIYDFITELYEWVYSKACEYESILLHDYLYDEDGHFFEFYKNDSHYIYQDIVSDLNRLFDNVKSVNYTLSNVITIRNYIAEIIRLYLMIQYGIYVDK
jgi:hypothetical protein